ncbi:hypothetical protein O1611_g1894 [Lasiodiplodia mahajangana]|uniref:Uncharacterized protein n=1 Tax=Lasiodiplodia mahajangana TaxID=1108764 RepID=A0ACC2JWF0_9PEZI|nr:hypothetical protein O1611_g1894 [Lasiodiplodia mahajangana]
MTEQLKSVPGKRQRRRSAKSCEPCRARKIKCDRGLPCRPCLRSRASLLCTYTSDHTLVSSGLEAHTPLRPESVKETGTSTAAPAVSRNGDAASPIDTPYNSHEDEASTPSLARRVNFLEQIFQTSEHECRPNSSLKDLEARLAKIEQRIGASSSESRSSDKSDLRIKLPRPHLRAEREKTRLFGKSHWVHSLEQFNILSQMQSKPYSPVDGVQAEANGAMIEAASARRHVKSRGAKLLRDPMPTLSESIPAKAICDHAIDGYLRTFEPIFRILHVPSFMSEYESYWTQTEPTQSQFLMKLTMVLTIGGIFLADRPVANEIKRSARNWVYAVQWWLVGPTEREAMSISGIQVFCLLLLARQTSALGGTSSIITEALSKLSFTLGLHVDPRFHYAMTPFESELRRRLWLTVLELTAITSLNSTLPLLLYAGDYQVPLPTNTRDYNLGKDKDAETPQEHGKHEGLDCSLQIVLAKSLRLRMQIIQELNDASREATYEKAIALSNNLQAHCREISAFFQPDEIQQDDLSPTPGFHHKFLDTYFRRLILFLHRPFAHQARKDHRYFLSRKICLESSLIMAAHTESMDLRAGNLDDFSYCCVSGSGMFKGAMGQDIILGVALLYAAAAMGRAGILDPVPVETNCYAPDEGWRWWSKSTASWMDFTRILRKLGNVPGNSESPFYDNEAMTMAQFLMMHRRIGVDKDGGCLLNVVILDVGSLQA